MARAIDQPTPSMTEDELLLFFALRADSSNTALEDLLAWEEEHREAIRSLDDFVDVVEAINVLRGVSCSSLSDSELAIIRKQPVPI